MKEKDNKSLNKILKKRTFSFLIDLLAIHYINKGFILSYERFLKSFFLFIIAELELLTPTSSIWNGFNNIMRHKHYLTRRADPPQNEILEFSDGLRKEKITQPSFPWLQTGICFGSSAVAAHSTKKQH